MRGATASASSDVGDACSLVALDPVEILATSLEEVERIIGGNGRAELAVHRGDGQLVNEIGIVVDTVGSDAVGRGTRVVAQVGVEADVAGRAHRGLDAEVGEVAA